MSRRPLIICDFPGTGKTFILRNCIHIGLTAEDTDIGMFGWRLNEKTGKKEFEETFPENYVEYITDLINKGETDIIFIDPHRDVRNAMTDAGIEFIFVYPDRSLKLDYLEEYRSRTYEPSFINYINAHWDALIDDVEKHPGPKLKLNAHEYMYPRIMEFVGISDLTDLKK